MNHPEDGDKIGRLRELMFEQVCLKKPNIIYTRFYTHLCFALIIHVCFSTGVWDLAVMICTSWVSVGLTSSLRVHAA